MSQPRPRAPLCPSAPAQQPGAVVIGVVGGTAEQPRVGYLGAALPATNDVLALTEPATPGEVLRIAAPCAFRGCGHFVDSSCRLASKIVQSLPIVSEDLPRCSVRDSCRWFAQEGAAACRRCPQVVTENWRASPLMAHVADPNVRPALARDAGDLDASETGAHTAEDGLSAFGAADE